MQAAFPTSSSESFQVFATEYTGYNMDSVADMVRAHGRESMAIVLTNPHEDEYLFYAEPYRDANEEFPEMGDVYTIHPDKRIVLYTRGEFEACFRWHSEGA